MVTFIVFGNGIQGLSPKYVSKESLKVFSSALYYNNEIKHYDYAVKAVDIFSVTTSQKPTL